MEFNFNDSLIVVCERLLSVVLLKKKTNPLAGVALWLENVFDSETLWPWREEIMICVLYLGWGIPLVEESPLRRTKFRRGEILLGVSHWLAFAAGKPTMTSCLLDLSMTTSSSTNRCLNLDSHNWPPFFHFPFILPMSALIVFGKAISHGVDVILLYFDSILLRGSEGNESAKLRRQRKAFVCW